MIEAGSGSDGGQRLETPCHTTRRGTHVTGEIQWRESILKKKKDYHLACWLELAYGCLTEHDDGRFQNEYFEDQDTFSIFSHEIQRIEIDPLMRLMKSLSSIRLFKSTEFSFFKYWHGGQRRATINWLQQYCCKLQLGRYGTSTWVLVYWTMPILEPLTKRPEYKKVSQIFARHEWPSSCIRATRRESVSSRMLHWVFLLCCRRLILHCLSVIISRVFFALVK